MPSSEHESMLSVWFKGSMITIILKESPRSLYIWFPGFSRRGRCCCYCYYYKYYYNYPRHHHRHHPKSSLRSLYRWFPWFRQQHREASNPPTACNQPRSRTNWTLRQYSRIPSHQIDNAHYHQSSIYQPLISASDQALKRDSSPYACLLIRASVTYFLLLFSISDIKINHWEMNLTDDDDDIPLIVE